MQQLTSLAEATM